MTENAQKKRIQSPETVSLNRRTVLQTGATALALGMTAGAGAFAAERGLKVGAAHEDITIPLPTEEFGTQYGPLAVRVILFDNGAEKTGLASIDLTSIGAPLAKRWAGQIARITGWPADTIRISAGHSFSTPHVFAPGAAPPQMQSTENPVFLKAIETALSAAAARAAKQMTAVRIGYDQGLSRLAVNRDMEYPAGWWHGLNDAGYSDHTLNVIRFVDAGDKTVAALVNYAVQPSVLSGVTGADGKRILSSDLTGALGRRMQAAYGPQSTVIFLPGAGGDQSPYLRGSHTVVSGDGKFAEENLGTASFVLLDQLSERLSDQALRTGAKVHFYSSDKLALVQGKVTLTGLQRHRPSGPLKTFAYQKTGLVTLPYSIYRIGNAVIVATAPELSATLGHRIRHGSPFAMTMVVTMVGNAAKYLPDQWSYTRITYEAQSAPFAPGSGEVFADAVIAHLKQLYHQ